jgi:hypothetical protein
MMKHAGSPPNPVQTRSRQNRFDLGEERPSVSDRE